MFFVQAQFKQVTVGGFSGARGSGGAEVSVEVKDDSPSGCRVCPAQSRFEESAADEGRSHVAVSAGDEMSRGLELSGATSRRVTVKPGLG